MSPPQITTSPECRDVWRRGLAHQAAQPSILAKYDPDEIAWLLSLLVYGDDINEPAPDHPNRNQ